MSAGALGRSSTRTTTRGAASRPSAGIFDTMTANPAVLTGSTSPPGAGIPAAFRAMSMIIVAVMKCHRAGFSIWIP